MYGCLRGLEPTLRQAQAEKRTWFYADNGYLKPGHYGGYYRITRNAYQIDGRGESDGKRATKLGITLKPWRRDGRHVLFCPISPTWGAINGVDPVKFSADTLQLLRRLTDRPLKVRAKNSGQALASDLKNAWCLVTYSSNAAVEALIAGIPVFCRGTCAASAMSSSLEFIDTPAMQERENWLGVLADNQWTLEEMRKGTAWEMLQQKAGSS